MTDHYRRGLSSLFLFLFFFAIGFVSLAPDTAASGDTNGTFRGANLGLNAMSHQSGFEGVATIQAPIVTCTSRGLQSAIDRIESTTRNTPELRSRYPFGLRHETICGSEFQPLGGDWDQCNGVDGSGSDSRCPFENRNFFHGSNAWDIYVWLDFNKESFRQSNNTIIGARVRRRTASFAYCLGEQAVGSNCGQRYVVQWNADKRPLNHPEFASLMVHELGHPQSLHDLTVAENRPEWSKMNYRFLLGVHGWTAYDRSDIASVYGVQSGCSVTMADFDNHLGRTAEFQEGTHRKAQFDAVGLNNKVGSLKVHGGNGCVATVCDWGNGAWNKGFGCRKFRYTGSTTNLYMKGRNNLQIRNRITYVRVFKEA